MLVGKKNRLFGRWQCVFLCGLTLLVSHSGVSAQQTGQPTGNFDTLLHQGFELHQKNDYAEAIPLLQKALRLQPKDYFANLLLGIDLLRSGQAQESIPYLKTAAAARPKEEIPLQYLGEAEANVRSYADAAATYQRAVHVASTPSADVLTSAVNFCLGRFAELSAEMRSSKAGLAAEYRLQATGRALADPSRRDLLERSVALDELPQTLAELAIAQAAQGDTEAAKNSVMRASAKAPDNLEVGAANSFVAAKLQRWPESESDLQEVGSRSTAVLVEALPNWQAANLIADSNPDPASVSKPIARIFYDCVRKHCSQEELRKSLPGLSKGGGSVAQLYEQQRWESVAATPAPPLQAQELWLMRGIALAHMEDCASAIPALERGLGATNRSSEGLFLLSRCYALRAGTLAQQLPTTGENDAAVHMMKGDVLLRLQANSAGAVTEYEAASAERPNDPGVWQRLAEAQLAAGHTEEARKSAEKALRIDPQRLSAMRTLAQAAMQERDYADALPYLKQLVARNPKDLAARVELATACSQTGAFEEAYKNLAPALQQGYPDEKGSLHFQLGTILRHLGKTAEAEQAFAEAREISDRFQHNSHQPAQKEDKP